MVCIGWKAQLLARRGMDIRGGNHPSRRRALSAVLTRVAYTLPNPGRRSVWAPHPNCGPSRGAGCSQPSSGCGTLEAVPLVRTAGNSGWSADTSAPGSPPRCLCPPPPSPPSPLASLRESPTHPGCSRPAPHRSRCAASRSHPLFSHGLSLRLSRFLTGKPAGQCRQHLRLVSLDSHQVVPPGSPVRG